MHQTALLWVLVAAAGLAVAPAVHADGSHRKRVGDRLVDAGGILLGASYTASFGTTAAIALSCPMEAGDPLCRNSRYAAGFAPVVGPWLQLGHDHGEASSVALFVVPAVVQVGGLAMMIAGGIIELRARN